MWVARRTRIRVNRFPRFGEHFGVTTYCSGLGRMWAERRTDIVRRGAAAPDVEGVSIWVHLDPERRMPSPVSEVEIATYTGPGTRAVSARLRHPAPPVDGDPAREGTWTFRSVDLDIAGHVNNAVYWAPLEEDLLTAVASDSAPEPERFDAELEYRTPAQAGVKRVLADGDRRWIVDGEGEVHASAVIAA
jgi:acyl-ACP thioesterase